MGRIGFNNARFDGVGEDTAEKANGAGGRSSAAANDRLSAQLLGLDRNPRLSGHDVFEDLVNVGLGEVLDPPCSYERNDMTLNAASVRDNCRRLLRAPSFSQDEA